MITKVLFMGDPCRGDQAANIGILMLLFKPLLKQLDISYSSYISDVNKITKINDWINIWKASLCNDDNLILKKLDLNDTLVIGFEIPEREYLYLNTKNIPWINITIHPIRFLDDLYLDISTSFKTNLRQHIASIGLIDMFVQALRVRYNSDGIQDERNTLGIFGQTTIDKSIFFDGSFKKLDNYLYEIDKLANTHEETIYKPHPYLSDPDIDDLIINRYNAELISDTDTYELFANGKFTTACGISSSVLSEAPYFGIKVKFLEQRSKCFGPPVSYHSLLDDNKFWSMAFGKQIPKNSLYISKAIPKNFLRKVFSSWGYRSDETILEEQLSEKLLKLTENSNEDIKSSLGEINNDIQGTLEQLKQNATKIAKQADLRSVAVEDFAKNAHRRSTEAKQFAKNADKRSTEAEQFAKDADKRSTEAKQFAKDAKISAQQSHELVASLTSELREINSSWSWKIISPIRIIEKFVKSKKLTKKNTCKIYRNLNVAWHTHLYRALITIFVKSQKPWHTHLYRSFLSLIGNEKYNPIKKTSK